MTVAMTVAMAVFWSKNHNLTFMICQEDGLVTTWTTTLTVL